MTHKLVLAVGLALAVAWYIGLAARHVRSPGMYVDEAAQLVGADFQTESGLAGDGDAWPLMNGTYVGALKGYVWAVPFRLFGFRIEVLRLTAIAVTAGGLIFAAMLAARMLGGGPALAAIWLLATDPSLILYTRTDWGPVAMGFTLRTALLYWLWRWWTGGGRTPLILAAAAAGLGLWDKASFAWVLLALLIVGVVAWLTDTDRPSLSLADAAWAIAAAVVCSGPFWTFNITNSLVTARSVARPGDSLELSAILERSASRTVALMAMFNGTATARWMFGASVPAVLGFPRTWLLPLSIVGAVVCVAGGLVARRAWTWAIPVIGLAIIAQIYLTPRPVWVHHWITIYPLPQLAIGSGLAFLGGIPVRFRALRIVATSLAFGISVAAVLVNVLIMTGYHTLMERTGGRGLWSDAIYGLSDTVQSRYPGRAICILDWGINSQLRFLSAATLHLKGSVGRYSRQTDDMTSLVTLLRDPASVFLFLAPGVRPSLASENLRAAARAACVDVKHTEQFMDRGSRPVYILMEYEPGSCEDNR